MARPRPGFKIGRLPVALYGAAMSIPRRAVLAVPILSGAGVALAQASIGTATLQQDGTLILRLRAQGPGGQAGESVLRYPPGHPERDMLIRHVGGLAPGQSKPFPPLVDSRPPAPR